jgi:hypothetical protein
MVSGVKPSFNSSGNVNLIMIGGPQTIAMVFSLDSSIQSRIDGTKPTFPFQSGVSPPGSTVVTSLISERFPRSSTGFQKSIE